MNNCIDIDGQQDQELHESLAERWERTLALCKDVAECLDGVLWDDLGVREKAARLLHELGFQSKAERFLDCHVTGIRSDCIACGEKYFSRYRCTLRFCEYCGPWHFMSLMKEHQEPITTFIASQASQHGRTLARITLTIPAYDHMPDAAEPKRLAKLVKSWFKELVRQRLWGCLFCLEMGHEIAVKHPDRSAGGWNLHVHALYYGPYIEQSAGLKAWQELLGHGGGVRIEQCSAWRHNPKQSTRRALAKYFRYVTKPVAVSAERIAALEVLFNGFRRVHALKCFYRLPRGKQGTASPRCPKCGTPLPINTRPQQKKSERVVVATLEREGRRDLAEVTREVARGRIFGERSP